MTQALSALAVGAKVKDTTSNFYGTPLIWKIADKNHAGYPASSVTLITEKIITLRAFDGKEPTNTDANRKSSGNNRYLHSNMRKWLNSNAAAGGWYASQHAYDAAPTAANVSTNPYDADPGFLNGFSTNFQNALLTTTLTVARNTVIDGGGSETVADKLFLPSTTEVGLANENNIVEGSLLPLFSAGNSARVAYPTATAVSNDGNATVSDAWYWWLRTPYAPNSYYARYVVSDGTLGLNNAYVGNYGVRPLCNLSSSILVSDSVDGDGCYTIVWNQAPTQPATITVPETIYSSQNAAISWAGSTDSDGDAITYSLERSANGGSFTQIYSGSGTTHNDTVTAAMNTVQYRVKAIDSYLGESAYTTSAMRTVIHNIPPAISGADGSLGAKAATFGFLYTITDGDSAVVTVTERIDGAAIKTYQATLGQENNMVVAGNDWVKLANGLHTLTVTATDSSGGSTTRTMTFIKEIGLIYAENTVPLASETRPARINTFINAEIPFMAAVTIEVCNNGYDANPAWEDTTEASLSKFAHIFTNTTKEADKNWGVRIRVSINRNGSTGDCYLTGIGGNFE